MTEEVKQKEKSEERSPEERKTHLGEEICAGSFCDEVITGRVSVYCRRCLGSL